MIPTKNLVSHYLIVGKLVNGKKFRMTHTNYHYVMGINLYDGRVYEVTVHGKRKLLKKVTP